MHLQTQYIGALELNDYKLSVPVDWEGEKSTPQMDLFYRDVCRRDLRDKDLPLLVYLQGGPGGQSPRPGPLTPNWLHAATRHYRVILPDQRGTGRSQRISGQQMQAFANDDDAARYLSLLDAHAIVHDLEYIRNHAYQGRLWSTLGQSYGGFLTLTYLSHAPLGLNGCMIAGGLPALEADADDVYRYTYERVAEKWQQHCRHFPHDQATFDRIADRLAQSRITLPNGDPFTVPRLQYLGFMLGMSDGSNRLHWLLEQAFADADENRLSHHFLTEAMYLTGMDDSPLFAAIHEHIYANPDKPCNFAAERQRPAAFKPEARPLYPTGEMMYPWMFDDMQHLQPYRAAVHKLAQQTLSKPYYDVSQLAENTVPVAAVIYFDDMYVDARLSLATAQRVGNLNYWLTNEYQHDGLRQDTRVFTRLDAMLRELRD